MVFKFWLWICIYGPFSPFWITSLEHFSLKMFLSSSTHTNIYQIPTGMPDTRLHVMDIDTLTLHVQDWIHSTPLKHIFLVSSFDQGHQLNIASQARHPISQQLGEMFSYVYEFQICHRFIIFIDNSVNHIYYPLLGLCNTLNLTSNLSFSSSSKIAF